MKTKKKNKVISIMNLIKDMHIKIQKAMSEHHYDIEIQLLTECQQAAIDVGEFLEKTEKKENVKEIISILEIYCEKIYQISCDHLFTNSTRNEVDELIDSIIQVILSMPSGKKLFVFLPYKASMWTALESVWKAADEAEDCEAIVMPIPYFTIGKYVKEYELMYEGEQLPDYVPIVDWQTYSLADKMPDAIFIHNPYDDGNNLTTVHPDFYSDKLKQYTDCLVYIPYFTMCGYKNGRNDFQYVNKGTVNADKVVAQSEYVKKIYASYGYSEEKIIATGSPKTDAVIRRLKEEIEYPEEWRQKLEGRKVFLLNTHLSYFPVAYTYRERYGYDYAQRHHDNLFNIMKNNKDYALIWRPHPLLFDFLRNNHPHCLEYAEKFAEKIKSADNCILDNNADYILAFACSDAMITTYSSMINEYMITGKPIMIFQTKQKDEYAEKSPVDLRVNYFRLPQDGGMKFEEFCKMIAEGIDPKKEERMKMLRERAFANLDGTAGIHVFKEIKKFVSE